MSEIPNWRCPSCGHESFMGITESPIEISILMFCAGCGTAMDRIDSLGALEAENRSGAPETFAEYVTRPEVLVLKAKLDE